MCHVCHTMTRCRQSRLASLHHPGAAAATSTGAGDAGDADAAQEGAQAPTTALDIGCFEQLIYVDLLDINFESSINFIDLLACSMDIIWISMLIMLIRTC